MRIHLSVTPAQAKSRAAELLDQVGVLPNHAWPYPHEFCRRQRQRIGIACAITLEPKMVILDEPVSALDVLVRALIQNLLANLQDRLKLTYVFDAPRPSPSSSGCRFHTPCPMAQDCCPKGRPALTTSSGVRAVACHFPLNLS
jgi:ABC-type dipeptide/oligopeptide/nickel transport system ATPase component